MRRCVRRLAGAPGASLNWCENVAFTHNRWAAPSDLAELRQVVSSASRLRVLGSGHSFSALCCSEETMVSLAFMNNILEVEIRDENDMRVHIEGGATIGDVVKYLAPRGFALKNIPSLPHITVAGGLATATHGSGMKAGMEAGLPSMCCELEFILHDGETRRYRRGEDEEFPAAVVSLGALGPVSRIALDVVPSYTVDQRVYESVPLDPLFDHLHELAYAVDSLTLGINFGTDTALVWNRYFEGGTAAPPLETELLGGKLRRKPVPFYESQVGVPSTCVGPWHDVPSFFMDEGREVNMPKVDLQSEYFVPLEEAVEALEAVRRVASRWPSWPSSESWEVLNSGEISVFHCEVRVIPRDNLSGLSPFADQDSLSIHFTWGDWSHEAAIKIMITELEQVLRPFRVRPHFGKLNFLSVEDLRAAYPAGNMDAFLALCHEHDPHGKFQNALFERQVASPETSGPVVVVDLYPA